MKVKAKNYLVKWNNFLVVVVLYEKKANFCLGGNFFDVFLRDMVLSLRSFVVKTS